MCRTLGTLVVVVVAIILMDLASCRHDPFFDNPIPGGVDTSSVDTTTSDTSTTGMSGCDPDSVYFNRDVLPLIISSCATSGCHDEITHEEVYGWLITIASYALCAPGSLRIAPYMK